MTPHLVTQKLNSHKYLTVSISQHIDVPTHTRGHPLDLVISDTSAFFKWMTCVSDYKVISLELPFLSPHSKPKQQICFRDLKNINLDVRQPFITHQVSWLTFTYILFTGSLSSSGLQSSVYPQQCSPIPQEAHPANLNP